MFEYKLRAQAYLANFVDRHDTYHPFCKNVPLYETIFSSPETSFVRMEENWRGDIKPVFVDAADGDKKRAQLVVKVHAGANEFVIDFMIRFEKMVSDVDFDPNKLRSTAFERRRCARDRDPDRNLTKAAGQVCTAVLKYRDAGRG